ncbi:MAG: hypothetical protein ACFB14_06075 [Leptolyngbyaceae cyanobacterium]
MADNHNSNSQASTLSIRPLESQTAQGLFQGDLKKIHGGLTGPSTPSVPPVLEPPLVPGICPPAPDLD